MSSQENQTFEEALARLKEIVDELENESITLEDSIELFEEGIKLSKFCTNTLEQAEIRIEKVSEEHENPDEKD